MVNMTFSGGVLFLNEKEAAWEAYSWAKQDRVNSVFVDFSENVKVTSGRIRGFINESR